MKEHGSSTHKEQRPEIQSNEILLSIDPYIDASQHSNLDLNLDDSLQKTLVITSVMNSEDHKQQGDRQNDSGSTIPVASEQNHPHHKGELKSPSIRSSAKFQPHSNSSVFFFFSVKLQIFKSNIFTRTRRKMRKFLSTRSSGTPRGTLVEDTKRTQNLNT